MINSVRFVLCAHTRGAEFSRSGTQILTEVKIWSRLAQKEIQLLGQNVNAWHGAGPDGHDWNLGRLIFAVAEIEGVERIRYTTSHPRDMHDELYDAHAALRKKLMPFFTFARAIRFRCYSQGHEPQTYAR